MNSKPSLTGSFKKVFKRNQEFTNICKICQMEFSDPERTKRHMMRAHSKPRKEKQVKTNEKMYCMWKTI